MPRRSADVIASPPPPLHHEFLHAFALERFTRIDVAAGIDGDAADAVEGAGIASPVTEAADRLERLAAQDEDLLIVSVRDVEVALLRIAGERHVPHRPGAFRRRRD